MKILANYTLESCMIMTTLTSDKFYRFDSQHTVVVYVICWFKPAWRLWYFADTLFVRLTAKRMHAE